VQPIDFPTAARRSANMGQLANYDVVVNGLATTLRLTPDAARARGLTTTAEAERLAAEQATAEAERLAAEQATAEAATARARAKAPKSS
jgi:hypothetical protein